MKKEQKYEFRRFLNTVHRSGRRDVTALPESGEMILDERWVLVVAQDSDSMAWSAAEDLQDYFLKSMGLSLPIRHQADSHCIEFKIRGEGKPRGFLFEASNNKISISGNDPAGVLQGGYYLEELLNLREAPYLHEFTESREPVFSPRMVHSGWGLDQFPDSQLNAIAHAGFDSILLFVKGVDLTTHGVMDFNDLIDRCANYALGVYFYSYLPSFKHPDEVDSEEFFESNFGQVFKNCPRAKGLILVGESSQFPSKDPKSSGKLATYTNSFNEGIADPRPCPGWWPCTDYPQWLNAVKTAVRRYQPNADIVFWSYNWGKAPEADRLALIRALPKDVTLEATFEMYQQHQFANHSMVQPDYSITFPGPGTYFSSEAKTASEAGLKLYTMSNTAGMTWDFGMIPYVPVPQQWFKRFDALRKANRDWNLTGLMDSHHYGWYPSPVAECAKWSFWSPEVDLHEILAKIVKRDFGSAATADALAAYQAWSDAMTSYTPGFDDQAGPLRTGPSYPFIFHPILYPHVEQKMKFPTTPQSVVGSAWIHAFYEPEAVYGQSWCGRRIHEDIRIMTETVKIWKRGVDLMHAALEKVPEAKKEYAEKLAGVGEYCYHAFLTMVHTKRWWVLNKKLEIESDESSAHALLDQMNLLIEDERKNVEETLPLVERDSRLGWEPSMDYICDPAHIRWKLRQLDNLQKNTIPTFRKSVSVTPVM